MAERETSGPARSPATPRASSPPRQLASHAVRTRPRFGHGSAVFGAPLPDWDLAAMLTANVRFSAGGKRRPDVHWPRIRRRGKYDAM